MNYITGKDIVRKLILMEVEKMQPRIQSFDENPMGYILQKYPTLEATLSMLMTKAYKDYITGIYIISPKPTTFKIVLHNDQYFYLTYLGKAYQATVQGKKYYLLTIGERERCMYAITKLLSLGNPIQTQGPEGSEKESAIGQPRSNAGNGGSGQSMGGEEAIPGGEEPEESESESEES